MAGILDSKTRIFDTVITTIGREQLSRGGFQIAYASFSDGATFYQGDAVSGSSDASTRLYLEAGPMPFDRITFKSDESGMLHVAGADPTTSVIGGRILSSSGIPVTGDEFTSTFSRVMSSSLDNFRKNMIVSSDDMLSDDSNFVISPNNLTFNITDRHPFSSGDVTEINVSDAESLFQDKRLSHLTNFAYLPPINVDGTLLGNYPRLGQADILSFEQLQVDLENAEFSIVTFPETSDDNNVVIQFFDTRSASALKLDLIDFGEFPSALSNSSGRHVFFAGRLFRDEMGADTYINIFTLVFE